MPQRRGVFASDDETGDDGTRTGGEGGEDETETVVVISPLVFGNRPGDALPFGRDEAL